ncbi:hypothetical protein Poly30_25700 [Planctomycetes bacterium Poly30]|uniref:Uncharacterized protein n=1 Tax=Saltatorellus ferox TaxID=2528018 RepID=A0A518ESH8_9BACT|nr:hypothetical protein Poly30_25700 [Planctomycetes bacterium Poly30]
MGGAVVVLVWLGLFPGLLEPLNPDGSASGLPALALAGTLAPALGAASGALLHAWTRRSRAQARLLATGLVAALPAVCFAGRFAFGLAHPAQAAGLAALWLIGVALVPAHPGSFAVGLARASALMVLALVLDGAASAWGLFQESPPWSPEVAARLLDFSPRAFTMEIAGFDWMRHPSVYESVGTDRISPTLRQPYGIAGSEAGSWRQVVAVLPLVVVGSTALAVRLFGRRTVPATRSDAAHPDSANPR